MRTILTIVLGLFIAQTLTAQNDSLVIKLDDYGQLLIVNSNLITKNKNEIELDKTYNEFYSKFKKIGETTFTKENYLIEFKQEKYEPENSIINIVEAEEIPDKYYFQKDEMGALKNHKFKVSFSSKIYLYLNSIEDFEKLAEISLDSLYNQSRNDIQSEDLNKRKPYLFFYNSTDNKLDNTSKVIYQSGKAQDFIELYPSFGMQVINSTFAPEISFNMDFGFGNKGLVGQRFGLSTTHLFIPDADDFFNVNSYNFVNVSYYLKMRNKWTHKVSIGYLYGKSGDLFGENTWNGYWQTTVNKIGIKLGGFLTKNNEDNYVVIPSIGFNFGF